MSRADRDPYMLFDYYKFEDHDLFFGREDEVFRMVGEVLSSRLLVLFSPSGSGKTSLINAGVRPALERHGLRTVYVRLDKEPETAIRDAIANDPVHGFPEFKDIAPTESLHADLCSLYAKLKQQQEVGSESQPTGPSLVIFMDQFEEFFLVFNAEVRQRFIKQLAEIRYDQNLPVLVVLSLRDDYFVQLNEFREDIPSIFQNNANIQLGPLSRESAQLALVEPAKACGATFDADLVDRILKDLATESAASLVKATLGRARLLPSRSGNEAESQPNGSAGASPSQQPEPSEVSPIILQIVAHTLWRERGGENTITTANYERLGAAKGILGQHLQAALNSVKPRPISLMQRLFQALMTPEQTKRFRSRSSLISLVRVLSTQRFDRLLEQLVNAHLLRKEDRNGEAWYEFRHDYLVPKLRDWNDRQQRRRYVRSWTYGVIAAFMLPVLLIASKYTLDYCTFEARFADLNYEQQHQEVIITRRWEPPWIANENRFRQGTWIFKDQRLNQDAENKLNSRFELNVGLSPDWSPLVPLLSDGRLGLAELEWLDRPISVPSAFLIAHDAVGWGRVETKLVTSACVASLKDQDISIRSRAAGSLVQLGMSDASVIEALGALLKDQDSNVRYRAAKCMVQLGMSDASVIEALVALLKDQDSNFRYDAAESLVQLGKSDARVIEALVALLKDQDSNVRSGAAVSLGQLGNSDASVIEGLVALLKDQAPIVRYSAAGSLVQLGKSDASLIEALIALLKDQDRHVRYSAAESLGQLEKSDANVIAALVALLKDQDSKVRIHAAASLVQLGKSDASLIEALVALLKDQDSNVRSSAVFFLEQLGKSDASLIETLVVLFKDQDPIVRVSTTVLLGQLGKSDANVIEALVALLKDPDHNVRTSAVASLGQLGKRDARVIEALVALFKDQDRYVRTSAVASLGQLGKSDARVIEALAALLKDLDSYVSNGAIKAIGMLGQKRSDWTDERMLADLADNDSLVRERAGIVLAYRHQQVGDHRPGPQVVEQIKQLRKDPRPWVKQAALHALYHIENRKAELEEEAKKAKQPKPNSA